MSGLVAVAEKRALAERVRAYINDNDPGFDEMIAVMDALSDVFSAQLEMPVKVSAKINMQQIAQQEPT